MLIKFPRKDCMLRAVAAQGSRGECLSRLPPVRRATTSCFSTREKKDPKQFQDMEHARTYLKSQRSGPSLPGFIQWLSERPGSNVGRLYHYLVKNLGEGQAENTSTQRVSHKPVPYSETDLERLQLLTLLDKSILARIVRTCPQILLIPHGDLAARLIHLKSLFQGCDPSILIERSPACYLLSSEATLRRMADMMLLLRTEMAGADVIAMVHEDPSILLLDLGYGVEEFKQLWDVDGTVLRDSDPAELAFAVRHLCAADRRPD